jgi:hypothetical protein
VRKQNSKKGRPRKVINQGKAKLSFTGKAVTSHAGMAIVSRALDYFNVREDLTSHTNDLDVAKHHKMNSLLEQLITLRMLGGEAVSDSAMLKDPALGALFDWELRNRPPPVNSGLFPWSRPFWIKLRYFRRAAFFCLPNKDKTPSTACQSSETCPVNRLWPQ